MLKSGDYKDAFIQIQHVFIICHCLVPSCHITRDVPFLSLAQRTMGPLASEATAVTQRTKFAAHTSLFLVLFWDG